MERMDKGNKMGLPLLVTGGKPEVQYLYKKMGLVPADVEIAEKLTPAQASGRDIFGLVPYFVAAEANSVTVTTFQGYQYLEKAGKEDKDVKNGMENAGVDIVDFASPPMTFKVEKLEGYQLGQESEETEKILAHKHAEALAGYMGTAFGLRDIKTMDTTEISAGEAEGKYLYGYMIPFYITCCANSYTEIYLDIPKSRQKSKLNEMDIYMAMRRSPQTFRVTLLQDEDTEVQEETDTEQTEQTDDQTDDQTDEETPEKKGGKKK